MALVRFTDAALVDLQRIRRKNPQIVRQVLKKCLVLERNPFAGEPLLGGLVGYRKIVVGNRDWRIVWRVIDDEELTIEVAEVWAVGARADGEVYSEVKSRIASMDNPPLGHALEQIVALLAGDAGIVAASEPRSDPIPRWLHDRLIFTAGVEPVQLKGMSGEEAMAIWERLMRDGSL